MKHKLLKKYQGSSRCGISIVRNMCISLVKFERISTTLAKAKSLRPFVEKIITQSADNSLASRRLLLSRLANESCVNKLIKEIGPRYTDRPGGYTRILKNGHRPGDNAKMAFIEFV